MTIKVTKSELNRVFLIGKNTVRIRRIKDYPPDRAGIKIKGERGYRCELFFNKLYDNITCSYKFGKNKCSCLAPCPLIHKMKLHKLVKK
ncbi:MAG: hypothetical protein QME12_05170 [Nanoarchaeota archaeon]|nr:hypothetical protein [Nanoarchaeota archaeon]